MLALKQVYDVRREPIREALLEKRSEILSTLGQETIQVASGGPISEADQAQVLHDQFVASRLNSAEYGNLRMVEEALDRLDTGDFGRCVACGRSLSLLRLQAIPWARYCVICQNRATNTGYDPIVRQNFSRDETAGAPSIESRF